MIICNIHVKYNSILFSRKLLLTSYYILIAQDDVIGAYLFFNGVSACMTFTKNGVSQGVAYEVSEAELGGKALYPHIR